MDKPELTVEYLRAKEAEYRSMAAQYLNLHFAAKGAADAIMMMLSDLTPAEAEAGASLPVNIRGMQ